MINKSYFSILFTLSIFALIYLIRGKWILADNISITLEELEEEAAEYRSKEKKLSLTKVSYTEGRVISKSVFWSEHDGTRLILFLSYRL